MKINLFFIVTSLWLVGAFSIVGQASEMTSDVGIEFVEEVSPPGKELPGTKGQTISKAGLTLPQTGEAESGSILLAGGILISLALSIWLRKEGMV